MAEVKKRKRGRPRKKQESESPKVKRKRRTTGENGTTKIAVGTLKIKAPFIFCDPCRKNVFVILGIKDLDGDLVSRSFSVWWMVVNNACDDWFSCFSFTAVPLNRNNVRWIAE